MAGDKLCRNVHEMADQLGISSTLLYRQAKAGKIPHVYVGDRMLFIESQVVEHLARQASASVREQVVPAAPAVRRRRRIVQPVGGDAA